MRALLAASLISSGSALQQHWPHFPTLGNIFGHSASSVTEDTGKHSDSQDVAEHKDHHHAIRRDHALSNGTSDILAQKHVHGDLYDVAEHGHRAMHHHHALSNSSYNRSLVVACSEVNSHDGVDPVDQARCLDVNVILLRIFKTGTSSMAGVLRRIAERNGLNGAEEETPEDMPEPLVATAHFPMDQWEDQPFVKAITNFTKPNFLVTLVRDPMERWLSDFYYRTSKGKESHDLMQFLKEYAKEKKPNFMINFLRPGHYKEPDTNVTPQQTLDQYSLVGVTERFDDTVVVLMFLLGIDSHCDVLYTMSKQSTSGTSKKGMHWIPHIPLEKQPAEIREYVQSEQFRASQQEDLELYAEAVRRLDAQIEAIGKERFLQRRNEYVKWKDQAQLECDGDGESGFSDCYFSDMGCERSCLDKFCAAHEEELKMHNDTTPMWGRQLFSAPLARSIHGS